MAFGLGCGVFAAAVAPEADEAGDESDDEESPDSDAEGGPLDVDDGKS